MIDQTAFDHAAFLKNLTSRPGVYRMLGAAGEVLYVGKASNLKKRVSSYFRRLDGGAKTRSMVAQIHTIEVTATRNESEALLLENNLIKELRPRYNILLRDDKSFPFIYLSTDAFPRLGFHRGAKQAKGKYFGPYPGAGAVRETLNLLQKLFKVRQCENSFFQNRTRPCLQYQIKRCTGPCVGLIDEAAYADDVQHAVLFLEGKSDRVLQNLIERMDQAATALDYEKAAHYRDQITYLHKVRDEQYVDAANGDVDVIAAASEGGIGCVQVFFIRNGRNLGNKTFYPKQAEGALEADLLAAFIPQYYLGSHGVGNIPREILVNSALEDAGLLEDVLGAESGHAVRLTDKVRGDRARWLAMAGENARMALRSQLASKATLLHRFEALQEALDLDAMPQRLECFDVSHTMGEGTVASCVVMDTAGFNKSDYRRFNITDVTGGDDYAAMTQALSRRYTRILRGEGVLPDLLIIDGGKGQLAAAETVLRELPFAGIPLLGIAKGPARRPGQEQLFLSGGKAPIILPADSPALHLLQQIRDEAHRFAISGHRQRRGKARRTSPLEQINGLGPKRRRQLLVHFGGLRAMSRAGIDELAQVPGISRELAQRVYAALHSGN